MKKSQIILILAACLIFVLLSVPTILFLLHGNSNLNIISLSPSIVVIPTSHENISSSSNFSKISNNNNDKMLENSEPKKKKKKRKLPKLFSYVQVSDRGTVKYQEEKGGPWIETKPDSCKIISSDNPRVIACDNFLTVEQCEDLIKLGEPLLKKSGVVADTNKNREIRSSFGGRLPSTNPLVKKIDRRILSMLQMSGVHAERLYLLRYEKGQKYVEHTDGFGGITGPIYASARRKRFANWIKKQQHQRKKQKKEKWENTGDADNGVDNAEGEIEFDYLTTNISDGKLFTLTDRAATVLLYLRGNVIGGNTSFPLLDRFGNALTVDQMKDIRQRHKIAKKQQKRQQQQHSDEGGDSEIHVDSACDPNEHFTVAPEAGKLLLFYDMNEDGTSEPKSSHAGCAVLGSTPKYTITKWLQIPLP